MTVKVRFAPSPTGRLHIGNIRAAVINWLFARKTKGTFYLRLDDTDVERSSEAFAQSIRQDMAWLGLSYAAEFRQSDRIALYDAAAARLRASGRLYPCYETPDELERRRKRQLARGLPPVYDRAALRLSAPERAALAAEGRQPHWRFLLDNHSGDPFDIENGREVVWRDLVRGRQGVTMSALSDPVLVRENGTYLYTFTSVVDDIEMAISHVVRGEDHVTNTAVQIQIFEALAAVAPVFAHTSLLLGADGGPLSKRLGGLAIASFQEAGLEPMAVVSHAATLGTSDPVAPFQNMDALAERFEFSKFGRAPARFDEAELRNLNARLLHEMDYQSAAGRLRKAAIEGGEEFWLAVRGNLAIFADVETWWRVVAGPVAPVIDDRTFIAKALELLPDQPWSHETWGVWTNAVKAATGAKGKALFQPLRLALTGLEHGPELKLLLPLIGPERAAARLAGRPV